MNLYRLRYPSLLLATCFALAGCGGDDLSESKAQNAIQKSLTGSMYCYEWPSKSSEVAILFDKETESLKKMAESGWVNVTTDVAKNVLNFVWYSTSGPKEGYALASHVRSINTKPDGAIYVVRLTEKGRSLHKPAARQPETGQGIPGLCFGQRVVSAIKRFSTPAPDASGKIVSEVAYRFDFKDMDQEKKNAWEKTKGKWPAGQEWVGIVQLMKTNNGWITDGNVRYSLEKI